MNITKNAKNNFEGAKAPQVKTLLVISSNLPVLTLYKILIKNPNLINTKDNKGETFLSYAIKRKNKEIIELLLTSSKLDLNYFDKNGNSYLQLAILYNQDYLVNILLEKNIEINYQNFDGNTALHLAYLKNNNDIIKLLISKNADFTIKNNNEKIPEDLFQKNENKNDLILSNPEDNFDTKEIKEEIKNIILDKNSNDNNNDNNELEEQQIKDCTTLIELNKTIKMNWEKQNKNNLKLSLHENINNNNNNLDNNKDKDIFDLFESEEYQQKLADTNELNSHVVNVNLDDLELNKKISGDDDLVNMKNMDSNLNINQIKKEENDNEKSNLPKSQTYDINNNINLYKNENGLNNKQISKSLESINKQNTTYTGKSQINSDVPLVYSASIVPSVTNSYNSNKLENFNNNEEDSDEEVEIINESEVFYSKEYKPPNLQSIDEYESVKISSGLDNNANYEISSNDIKILNSKDKILLEGEGEFSFSPCSTIKTKNKADDKINNENNNINIKSFTNEKPTERRKESEGNLSPMPPFGSLRYSSQTEKNSINSNNNNKSSTSCPFEKANKKYESKTNISNMVESTKDFSNNKILYTFLSQIEMIEYYNILNDNGFEDITTIVNHCKKGIYISDKQLKEAGLDKPGVRAKLLIRLQELADNFNFLIPKNTYYKCKMINNLEGDPHIIKLRDWLKKINMEDYLNNFVMNGYHSIELLLIQMESNNPLTQLILKNEIGINKIGHQLIILNELKDQGKILKEKLKAKNSIYNKENSKICDCLIY